jgi:hypothetical protein
MANPFFDAAHYLAKNPDVAAAGYTPATAENHYLKYGASESLVVPARAPNAWFDIKSYLAAYPDLAGHGITAADALNHYLVYGFGENRIPAPNARPEDFTYAHYAASNPDLVAAFGITDTSQPSIAQQHQLLAHFFSYGLHEHRGGVDSSVPGSFFSQAAAEPPALAPAAPPVEPPVEPPVVPPVTPGQPIVVDPSGTYIGTSGDDIFTANQANLNHSILDGLAGNDSLQLTMDGAPGLTTVALTSIENIAVTLTGANTLIDTGGPGVESITVSGAPGGFLAYEGDKIASLTLAGNLGVNAAFTPATVAGADDTLNITVASGVQGATLTSHIEVFDIAFGTDTGASALSLGVGTMDSDVAAVFLSGGQAGEAVSLNFNGLTPAPQILSVNGAAVAGNLTVSLEGMAGASATLIGGSGDDHLTAVSEASQNSTLNGGAGNDTLTASAGIDTMTGGAGNDIFTFSEGANALARIVGLVFETDRITDFSDGDQLDFTGVAATLDPLIATAIESVGRGVVTFKAGFLSGITDGLAGIVAAIDTDMMLAGAGEGSNLLFNDGTASYFLHTGADLLTSSLVKLEVTGVAADLARLTADALGAHYTAAPV